MECNCYFYDIRRKKHVYGWHMQPLWVQHLKWVPARDCREGTFHPKNENVLKMYSTSGHLICRWVCFFMRTNMEKYSSTSLAHQWILCMEWVPSDPLVSKYVMLNYSKSVPVMKKKSIYWIAWGWAYFQQMLISGVKYSFSAVSCSDIRKRAVFKWNKNLNEIILDWPIMFDYSTKFWKCQILQLSLISGLFDQYLFRLTNQTCIKWNC